MRTQVYGVCAIPFLWVWVELMNPMRPHSHDYILGQMGDYLGGPDLIR